MKLKIHIDLDSMCYAGNHQLLWILKKIFSLCFQCFYTSTILSVYGANGKSSICCRSNHLLYDEIKHVRIYVCDTRRNSYWANTYNSTHWLAPVPHTHMYTYCRWNGSSHRKSVFCSAVAQLYGKASVLSDHLVFFFNRMKLIALNLIWFEISSWWFNDF